MPPKDSLEKYRKKRDFRKTSEPKGRKRRSSKKPIFVIQKHKARNLHYDFRVEVDGVLKSWAVPKGPSLDPSQKRLAIAVEDHPLEYANFEGVIPKGEYGAGEVIVWDKGTYRNIKKKDGEIVPMKKCVQEGVIEIELKGRKLKGGFALRRFRRGEKEMWLLIKMRDQYVNRQDILQTQPKSVSSGMTIEEIDKS